MSFDSNATVNAVARSESQDVWIVGGTQLKVQNVLGTIYSHSIARSDDGGTTWTFPDTPWDEIPGGGSSGDRVIYAVIWVEELGKFFAGGYSHELGQCLLSSDDAGITWVVETTPFDSTNCQINGLAWSGSLMGAAGSDASCTVSVASSADGSSWTGQATDIDGGSGVGARSIHWSSATSTWYIGGSFGSGTDIVTSPDLSAFTTQTSAIPSQDNNGFADFAGAVYCATSGGLMKTTNSGVAWTTVDAVARNGIGTSSNWMLTVNNTAPVVTATSDGASFDDVATPMEVDSGYALGVAASAAGVWLVGGTSSAGVLMRATEPPT